MFVPNADKQLSRIARVQFAEPTRAANRLRSKWKPPQKLRENNPLGFFVYITRILQIIHEYNERLFVSLCSRYSHKIRGIRVII